MRKADYRTSGSLLKTWVFSAIEMEATGASWTVKEYGLFDILTRYYFENRLKWEQGQKKGGQLSYLQQSRQVMIVI